MSEQLLTVLKLCLLVLLYLFFFRVLRSVWVEINGPKPSRRQTVPVPAGGPAMAPPGPPPAPAAKGRKAKRGTTASQLTVVEPHEQRGRIYPLGAEVTVGRAAGCGIVVDDSYASQLHARVFEQDGQIMVEDLGSTNGTMLNKRKVTAPTVMHRGDQVQVGNTVMELT